MSVTSDSGAPKVRRAPRWLWIGFLLSLALNLTVIGVAVGAAWKIHGHQRFCDGAAPRHLGWFLGKLPGERREVFCRILRDGQPELQGLRADVRAARGAIREVLAEERWDKARFAAATRRLHDARVKYGLKRSEIFPRIAEAMTVAERQEFARWHSRRARRWQHWHRRD